MVCPKCGMKNDTIGHDCTNIMTIREIIREELRKQSEFDPERDVKFMISGVEYKLVKVD